MNSFILLSVLAIATLACAKTLGNDRYSPDQLTAYGYLTKIGIPRAEEVRKAEEQMSKGQARIVGGVAVEIGQYPWQAGLVIDLEDVNGQALCGASLIGSTRLLTAAHCWYDGMNQASRFTIVLGSSTVFEGGVRYQTSDVVLHQSWLPLLIRNDVAVIKLQETVAFTDLISPIALPSGSELEEDFAGDIGLASGFGLKYDGAGISTDQFVSQVSLQIMTNSACRPYYILNLSAGNICTSGYGGVGTCSGDSGGPLVTYRNGKYILIGVTSYGSALGCEVGFPSVFARVTAFIDFINENL